MQDNNSLIKRGSEIKNGKDATIYTLTFFKDSLKMYLPYLLDWNDWFEKENNYIKDQLISNLTDKCEDKKRNFVKSVKIEKRLCKSIVNEIIEKIENAIKVITEDKEFILYKGKIQDIKNSIEKLGALVEYFSIFSMIGFLEDNLSFYESIVSTPIFTGFSLIESIIQELENVTEETLKMKIKE